MGRDEWAWGMAGWMDGKDEMSGGHMGWNVWMNGKD